jgi:2-dehydro-3-deoxyphosphogluconate aldolase / (4S)-4-hydroxy-2-oxoglutarate aldolase
MSIETIVARVERAGLVPVIRAKSVEQALTLSKALHRGGIESLEITMTVPGATEVIATLKRDIGDTALLGAGTVLSREDAQRCIDAGATFLVSPGHVSGLVEIGHKNHCPVMMGALTPSEVFSAWREGSDFVKVFPCSALGGASYLKALAAPFPQIKLLPTGGVTLGTIAEYVSAGAAALGVGNALADIALLEREGADAVTALAKRYHEAFTNARAR